MTTKSTLSYHTRFYFLAL